MTRSGGSETSFFAHECIFLGSHDVYLVEKSLTVSKDALTYTLPKEGDIVKVVVGPVAGEEGELLGKQHFLKILMLVILTNFS